jgi:hypothetical protein
MKSKPILIVIGLILLSMLKSNAQNLRFGLLGGVDKVNIHQKPWLPHAISAPFDPMNSYNVNCFISYKSQGIWGFSFEPGFIQKGGANGVNDCCRWELNYFQFPLLAEIYVLRKLFLSVGPEFSYLTSAKAVNVYPSHTHTTDVSSTYKYKLEISGLIGINYMISKRFDIGLRYNHGFTYIAKIDINIYNGSNWYIYPVKQQSQYLQLVLRVRINTI